MLFRNERVETVEKKSLTAVDREPGHPGRTRRQGFVPAVLYGRNVESRPVQVDSHALDRFLASGGGRGIFPLSLEGEKKARRSRNVLIKELQRDPFANKILHLDFYEVDMKERIASSVPLRIIGEEGPVAAGAIVQHQLREVEVECLPGDLPEVIEADVSGLSVGESLTVAGLKEPPGVTILNGPDDVIVSLVLPRAEALPEEEEVEEVPAAEAGEEGAEAAGAESGKGPEGQE